MKKLLITIIILLWASGAWGADIFWVDTSGGAANWAACESDADPGAGNRCTLAQANAGIVAGETAVLVDGDYSTTINPTNSGSSGNPITFISQYEHNASGSQYGVDINVSSAINFLSGQDYIIIDGIEIDNSSTYWLIAVDSDFIEVKNCRFKVKPWMNYWTSFEIGQGCDYWKVHDNIFQNDIGESTCPGDGQMLAIRGTAGTDPTYNYVYNNTFINGRDHDFLTIDNGGYNVIYGNIFYNDGTITSDPNYCNYGHLEDKTPHEFIVVSISSYNNVVENNTGYEATASQGDLYSVGIHSLASYRNIFRGNKFYNKDSVCINIFTNHSWWRHAAEYNSFYHNTCYNNMISNSEAFSGRIALNVYEGANGAPGQIHHNRFANNIISTGAMGRAVYMGYADYPAYDNPASPPFYDNFFYGNWFHDIHQYYEILHTIAPSGSLYKTLTQAETDWGSTYYENYSPNPNPTDAVDPKLTDPLNGNFTLQSDSGCIDAAQPLTYTNGSGSGTSMDLDDYTAWMFQALSITGWSKDTIYVDNPSSADFSVQLSSITDHNTVVLLESKTWDDNASVYWCPQGVCFSGSRPDIGAEELGTVLTVTGPNVSQGCADTTYPYEDTQNVSMTATTSSNATCKYDLQSTDPCPSSDYATAYTNLANTFGTTGTTSHSTDVSSSCSTSINYTIICQDTASSLYSNCETINITVAPGGGEPPQPSTGGIGIDTGGTVNISTGGNVNIE